MWHGRGAVPAEQTAARAYASALAPVPEAVLELTEEESESEEMFWAILGEGDYAHADYWRWRPEAPVEPRVWAVDATSNDAVSGRRVQHFFGSSTHVGCVIGARYRELPSFCRVRKICVCGRLCLGVVCGGRERSAEQTA